MAGLGAQGKRKKELRSVDMSATPDAPPSWQRPPDEECEEAEPVTLHPVDADPDADRVKLRMVNHVPSAALAEFAVIQETRYKGKWCSVAAVDSSHPEEVHFHRYGRKNGKRQGHPEHLCPVRCLEDIAHGYDLAYERIVDRWAENKARWHDG